MKKNKKERAEDIRDWYDDYKHGYDPDKEKRRYADAKYAIMCMAIGFGGLMLYALFTAIMDKFL